MVGFSLLLTVYFGLANLILFYLDYSTIDQLNQRVQVLALAVGILVVALAIFNIYRWRRKEKTEQTVEPKTTN
jgi:uncharacterized membrane protein (DUF485 family)